MDIWYGISKGICLAYIKVLVRGYHVSGRENLVPGPKIIVANHPNASDAFYLPFIVDEKLYFFIQESLLEVPLIGFLLKKAGQIPVSPNRRSEAIKAGCEKLSAGNVVVIFPEGLLNHGNELHRAKTGAANLALESRAPIVPVGFYVRDGYTRMIEQSRESGDRAARWQFGGRCFIQIGKPWYLDRDQFPDTNPRAMREITEKMMRMVENLVEVAEEEAN